MTDWPMRIILGVVVFFILFVCVAIVDHVTGHDVVHSGTVLSHQWTPESTTTNFHTTNGVTTTTTSTTPESYSLWVRDMATGDQYLASTEPYLYNRIGNGSVTLFKVRVGGISGKELGARVE